MERTFAEFCTTRSCGTLGKWQASSPVNNPKIAGRLPSHRPRCKEDLSDLTRTVARGFCLAGRAGSSQIDPEFPRFTQALLETVYLITFTGAIHGGGQIRDRSATAGSGRRSAIPRGTSLKSNWAR